jgi:hypothetical protein
VCSEWPGGGSVRRDFALAPRGFLHVHGRVGHLEDVGKFRFRQLINLPRRDRNLERFRERFWGPVLVELGRSNKRANRRSLGVSFVNYDDKVDAMALGPHQNANWHEESASQVGTIRRVRGERRETVGSGSFEKSVYFDGNDETTRPELEHVYESRGQSLISFGRSREIAGDRARSARPKTRLFDRWTRPN